MTDENKMPDELPTKIWADGFRVYKVCMDSRMVHYTRTDIKNETISLLEGKVQKQAEAIDVMRGFLREISGANDIDGNSMECDSHGECRYTAVKALTRADDMLPNLTHGSPNVKKEEEI